MKAIMVMFDTLNRHMLSPYSKESGFYTPHFERLAERTVMFRNSYIGSMPCMPARRELHTGRYNFLHRGWGPLEPFDDSSIELLGDAGIYTHLVTDHQHYWEDGGGTYHTRFRSFELIRGQEGDPWKGEVGDAELGEWPEIFRKYARLRRQDAINRKQIRSDEDFPQARTFEAGMSFMRENASADKWFLQLETFDPHEPFHSAETFRRLYPHYDNGKSFDWPAYGPVKEPQEDVEHMRYEYASLLAMCDHYLGRVLDLMDELGLWEDTLLIVNTDHGFLLGEHDQWAKCTQPFYNEVAHTPLFVWDPRSGKQGEARDGLVQTIDLPATLLDYFGVDRPADMQGKPLTAVLDSDEPLREAALFGLFGAHVNVTDGRYVYMRAAADNTNTPLFEYTLMPTRMRSRFHPDELQDIRLAEPFSFTKGVRPLQVPGATPLRLQSFGTLLFDLERDPKQREPIDDPETESRMIQLLLQLMLDNDAPPEQYIRLGLPVPEAVAPKEAAQ